MAFNGTRRFERQELVDYLEGIGMRFGPDLNAYTGFDQTVYMLQVPTDPAILERGLDILEDWAQGITFAGEEIDRERGVVIEEWRGRRGAGARVQDQQFPVLFKGSRYAERLPIGKVEVLQSFPHDELRRFYRDWYRPDLQAIVAVGDFDAAEVEKMVRERFAKLRPPAEPRPRIEAEVPDHDQTLFSIVSDHELQRTSVSIAWKRDRDPEGTVGDYRRALVEALFFAMLDGRLAERRQEAAPPFLGASASGGSMVRTKDVNMLSATVEDGGLDRGLETLLVEAQRARRHGFLASELEREKTALLRSYEQALRERDKTHSRSFASEYVGNFLDDEPIPGIEFEAELARRLVPGIPLQEVNRLAESFLKETNRVILVAGPESAVEKPTEQALLATFERVAALDIEPWIDKVTDGPLLAAELEPVEVLERKRRDDLGTTEWKLANGVRVIAKPTDFKNDQVLFSAYSLGGHSLVADEDWVPAITADAITALSGVGEFGLIELQKALTGKVVSVTPSISELTEGLSGGASPEDLETLFQLVYLYATAPRKDAEAFDSYRARMKGIVANREARPETVYEDRLSEILSQGHARRRPFTSELLDELDLERSYRIYADRFADLGDSTFFFVGAFELGELEALARRYLGNLPSNGRAETFRDIGVVPPRGVVVERVYRGLEEKSQVRIVWDGELEWSRANRYYLASMAEALSIRLRESLREDLGGTYGVRASSSTSLYPRARYGVTISFGCAPERIDELVERVFSEIHRIKEKGVPADLLTKIKETQRRQRETDLEENGFWLSTLRFYDLHREDPGQILDLETWIAGLASEDIRDAARRYLDEKNYVQVALLPERMAPAPASSR
ncbi:MAG TPA: insulinase family protein, partial [Thermoanaerobaculia bacterium]|nr:insulinase family protein [Thermoanaerobaculia bacterium]